MAGRSSFQQLPDEILVQISHHLAIQECKALRVASSTFAPIVTSTIFQEFVLYPHQRSFERLESLATSPLRSLVRSITLETQHIDSADNFVWHAKNELPDSPGRESRLQRATEIHQQRLLASSPLDYVETTNALRNSIKNLDNLKQIRSFDSRGGHHGIGIANPAEIPSFYKTLMRPVWSEEGISQVPAVLPGQVDQRSIECFSKVVMMSLNVLQPPLERLLLYNVTIEQVIGFRFRDSPFWVPIFEPLQVLELSDEMDFGEFEGHDAMESLQVLLRHATSLQSLALRFRRCPLRNSGGFGRDYADWRSPYWTGPVFGTGRRGQVPHQLTWSKRLAALSLGGLICTPKEIEGVLTGCAHSLRVLALSDFVLIPEEPGENRRETPRVCLVALLKNIQSGMGLKLTAIILKGGLTNTGAQNWYILPPDDLREARSIYLGQRSSSKLRDRVHGYLLNGGECPLDHLAINPGRFDFRKEAHDTVFPAEEMRNPFLYGDDTFSMDYKFANPVHVQDLAGADDQAGTESSQWEPDDGYDGLAFHEMADFLLTSSKKSRDQAAR